MSPGPVGKLKKYVDVSGFQAIPSPATVSLWLQQSPSKSGAVGDWSTGRGGSVSEVQ